MASFASKFLGNSGSQLAAFSTTPDVADTSSIGMKEYALFAVIVLIFCCIFSLTCYLGSLSIIQNPSRASCYANVVTKEDFKECLAEYPDS